MFKQLKNWLQGASPEAESYGAESDSKIDRLTYAIGDVHGCYGLLVQLMAAILEDSKAFAQKPRLIFLGDYIDRGPASREVLDMVAALVDQARQGRGDFQEVIALMGNHELTMLQFLQDAQFGPPWSEHGGLTALASYGVKAPFPRHDTEAWEATRLELIEALPSAHLRFLEGLPLFAHFSDYVFVHAGVRPGVRLEAQVAEDLLWIRGEFIAHPKPSDFVIVHGHTAGEAVINLPWRIGLDTGAYATGRLTAMRLFEGTREIIQTGDALVV